MTQTTAPIRHLTPDTVATWYQQHDLEMVVGDALDPTTAPLVIGFARYRKGPPTSSSPCPMTRP